MPIYMTFVMGPKESYFFNTPTHWAWHNLPPEIEALFTTPPPPTDVLELALGDAGAYFMTYRDASTNTILCKHYNLPNPLTEYLYHGNPHVIRDLATLSVSLGPYESYYAHDKNSASWANLPAGLEKAVLGRLVSQDAGKTEWREGGGEAPSFVSLGADGSYFMRTVAGGGSWDLRSKEEGMVGTNRFLDGSRDFSGVAGLYLFPHHPTSYILLLTTGKAFSNLPEHTWEDYNKISPRLPQLRQSNAPIPCIPILPPTPQPGSQSTLPLQQPQSQSQSQSQTPLPPTPTSPPPCYPNNTPATPHTCTSIGNNTLPPPYAVHQPPIPQNRVHHLQQQQQQQQQQQYQVGARYYTFDPAQGPVQVVPPGGLPMGVGAVYVGPGPGPGQGTGTGRVVYGGTGFVYR